MTIATAFERKIVDTNEQSAFIWDCVASGRVVAIRDNGSIGGPTMMVRGRLRESADRPHWFSVVFCGEDYNEAAVASFSVSSIVDITIDTATGVSIWVK